MFRTKPKKLIRIVFWVCLLELFSLGLYVSVTKTVWHSMDFWALDRVYRIAVDRGEAPKPSFGPGVVYLLITDASYDTFGKNHLDRADMARVNEALAGFSPLAVAYDIIFARKSSDASDQAFSQSLGTLDNVWLPLGLGLSDRPGADTLNDLPGTLQGIRETGNGTPFSGTRVLAQYAPFAQAAAGTGHISVQADSDGIFRRLPLLVRLGNGLFPSLGLALFLDWAGVLPEQIRVDWGSAVTIEAGQGNALSRDLVIPIDRFGQVLVPFVNRMGQDFPAMAAHRLVAMAQDDNLKGNLLDLVEDNWVLVADTATGTSDLGDTPLEPNAPLVVLHAALLNGLATGTFYRPWPLSQVLGVLALALLLLGGAAMMKSPGWLYGTGLAVLSGIAAVTWMAFTGFSLFPFATATLAVLVMFSGLIISLEAATARDRAFIKQTFARYVPAPVVKQLLDNPRLLALGGQTREATVFFSDIAGFTSLSEQLPPDTLVALLNLYFTEMTAIIQAHGGIIDKYIGDAIMAEFGVPVPCPDHADQAVAAALAMQERLGTLQKDWEAKGFPRVTCRMGINTGPMVVGNMGSDRVFDYTALGDAVNLASRLEGANKAYGTAIMISEQTRAQLTPGRFTTRLLDRVVVKGQTRAVFIHEVLGDDGQTGDDHGFIQGYETAFQAYLAKDFAQACQGFERALAQRPGDRAAQKLLDRTRALAASGRPGPDWDGAVRLTEK